MDREDVKLRRAIFKWYLCSPRQLERLIRKALGCASLRFKGILGQGSFNLVLDAEIDDQRAAIRLPRPHTRPQDSHLANSRAGYGATVFMSQLHLPVLTARLVQAPLPYIPRSKSQLVIMEVAPGVALSQVWNHTSPSLPLEVKQRVLADMAAVAAELYRHPLPALGDMAVAADGSACVAELSTGTVAAAIRHGIDVGHLSPGPYATWKEFARNELEGLRLLGRVLCPPAWLGSLELNLDLLLKWLEKFNPPAERNDRFYLYHPEIRLAQIMVDPRSGRLHSILDWDGARTGTIHSLGEVFYLLHQLYWEDRDEGVLHDFYCAQLERRGAAGLVAYVRSRGDDPQLVFEEVLRHCGRCRGPILHTVVARLCYKMQNLGLIGPREKIMPGMPDPPWMRDCPGKRRSSVKMRVRAVLVHSLIRPLKRLTRRSSSRSPVKLPSKKVKTRSSDPGCWAGLLKSTKHELLSMKAKRIVASRGIA